MKLSVSLPDEDVATLDRYVTEEGLPSRSAALQQAIHHLRDRRLADEGLASRMLLQVHDELVLEVAPGETDAVSAVLVEEMAGAAELSVPLDVSVGTGPNWRVAGH